MINPHRIWFITQGHSVRFLFIPFPNTKVRINPHLLSFSIQIFRSLNTTWDTSAVKTYIRLVTIWGFSCWLDLRGSASTLEQLMLENILTHWRVIQQSFLSKVWVHLLEPEFHCTRGLRAIIQCPRIFVNVQESLLIDRLLVVIVCALFLHSSWSHTICSFPHYFAASQMSIRYHSL